MDTSFHNNNFHILEEGRKQVFDGIEHGKVVILNYRLGYKHFSSAIARIKNAIAGYNFHQPSSPPLAVIGERVKMKNEKKELKEKE